MSSLYEPREGARHEREAAFSASAARALAKFGFEALEFEVGGKKSRRRFVLCRDPDGHHCSIWIKSSTHWPNMAEVVRFPWKKVSRSSDGAVAVAVACGSAADRGVTHLLGVAGEESTGQLTTATLLPIATVPALVIEQAKTINSVFYRAHNAALIIKAISAEFTEAEALTNDVGIDILDVQARPSRGARPAPVTTVPSTPERRRNQRVRAQVLEIANGRCECCGELGFQTASGERYLETHHVVGVAERGPDSVGNIIAVCPLCHRKAHFAEDHVQIEREMLEAIRRRGRRPAIPV